jgi:hypothetical protein
LSQAPAQSLEIAKGQSQFGFALSAGDVNGDGFSDVLVGAKNYSNGENAEGAAFLFLGGKDGLQTTPAWQAESDVSGAEYGCSVAIADLAGDGFKDILVGAWLYGKTKATQGCAYAYYAKSAGISAAPDVKIEGDQEGCLLGFSTYAAGDVNHDGYEDLVIGAPVHTGFNGQVRLYHGSVNGLQDTPFWTKTGEAYGDFGYCARGAGDLNGDGYADLVISAPYFKKNGVAGVGRAYLFYGRFDSL